MRSMCQGYRKIAPQKVQERFKSLQESMNDVIEECEKEMKSEHETLKCDDGISVSGKSRQSSTYSNASSSRKEKSRAAHFGKEETGASPEKS